MRPNFLVPLAGLALFPVVASAQSNAPEQRNPEVSIAYPESSAPLFLARPPSSPAAEVDHEVRHNPWPRPFQPQVEDPVLQSFAPTREMPTALLNFEAQGKTKTPNTVTGTPPDTNGAVGPNHFVQTVNGGLEIWDKAGNVKLASEAINVLWAGYVGTNPGNKCAADNDGDPVVVYDVLADRWVITQFAIPNNNGPDWQCVAVSKTPDPTGQYWLYDFQYSGFNDYGKFGIWPDGYYATYNMFPAGASDLCAFDRVSMLQGKPATQQCFQQSGNFFGALPVSLEGQVAPPRGEPGYFLAIGQAANSLDLWKLHLDWKTPANTKLTGPSSIPVAAFTEACSGGGTCIAGGNTQLDSLADRLMFRLVYRNFGTHEVLMVNHSVTAGSTSGLRWYELRSPNGTPSIYQQGTYAPDTTNFRWMGSLAEDMAQDFALGFSISSGSQNPQIAWTGRLATDTLGQMLQGETVLDTGLSTETTYSRWGDYSNMTVDPADDCTFWYTTEVYNTAGPRTWDTYIATTKFPRCGANDFTLALSPASQMVAPGGQATFSVNTTKKAGTAETVTLNIQDLPVGVTAAFNPATVTAGSPSTLTISAAAGAALTPAAAFTVIGTAASAVHPAGAQVGIAAVPTVGISAPANGATVSKTVGVTANATAATGGTLATLALTIDGTSAQSGATSPLNYSWDTTTVSNGAHTLLATATDTDGASASLPVTVTVLNNPAVAITSPVGGATVSGTVPITANATVPGGTTLTSFVISVDGTQVLTGAASPATFSWDTTALADGSPHTLSVTATDADTGTASTSITVTVSNTPTSVAVTAPANNATVSGSTTVTVKAAVGNGVTVTNLLLAIDGRQVQTAAASTLSFTWDTTQVANGSHSLAANVTDSKGTSASSTAVTVTVANNTQGGGDGGSGGGGDGGSHGGGGSNGGCGCGAAAGAPAVGLLCSLLAWAGARRRRR